MKLTRIKESGFKGRPSHVPWGVRPPLESRPIAMGEGNDFRLRFLTYSQRLEIRKLSQNSCDSREQWQVCSDAGDDIQGTMQDRGGPRDII